MKPYDAIKRILQTQLDTVLAWRASHDVTFDPDAPENRQQLMPQMLRESLSLAIAVLARLDVVNETENDQAHTSARELVKHLSQRLDIDVSADLGIPLEYQE